VRFHRGEYIRIRRYVRRETTRRLRADSRVPGFPLSFWTRRPRAIRELSVQLPNAAELPTGSIVIVLNVRVRIRELRNDKLTKNQQNCTNIFSDIIRDRVKRKNLFIGIFFFFL